MLYNQSGWKGIVNKLEPFQLLIHHSKVIIKPSRCSCRWLNDITLTLTKCVVQSVYVAKFFWWEAGYFSTLDIILDRAGYYICWGCLVWVPCLYTFSSYYLVAHPPIVSTTTALLMAMLGLFAILLNYCVDLEKQLFRRTPDGNCNLWGKPVCFIEAQYQDSGGNVRTSKLLLSGKCIL